MTGGLIYDYIIAGAGCAGLSLAMQLKRSGKEFNSVLIIDKDKKDTNDRTWCFWTKGGTQWYQPAISASWSSLVFRSPGFENRMELEGFRYHMIRGVDFYNYCLRELDQDARFTFVTGEIKEMSTTREHAMMRTADGSTYAASYIFNSAFRSPDKRKEHVNFVQHFKGWVIETHGDCFDDTAPVLMDFEVEQRNDCRFVYVIPYSKKKALVEYTGFSLWNLPDKEYDEALREYISGNLGISEYKICECEKGEIPMAESSFINSYGGRVINIGTAGGSSKAGSGYTFYFIQRHVQNIVSSLEQGIEPTVFKRKKRYLFYDSTLLHVMNRHKGSGLGIFTALFKRNRIDDLLEFLNEEGSFTKDLKVINALPKKQFLCSALSKLFK